MESVPSVLSFLVCDMIITEAETQKKTLVGIFDNVNAAEVPVLQRLAVYARLTDLEGAYKFAIRLVHLGEKEELVGLVETPQIQAGDRLGIVELALNLPPVHFPKFGRYEFLLFSNDVYVGRAITPVVKTEGRK